VLDLTNSSRYYRFDFEVPDAEHKGICYRKVYMQTCKHANMQTSSMPNTLFPAAGPMPRTRPGASAVCRKPGRVGDLYLLDLIPAQVRSHALHARLQQNGWGPENCSVCQHAYPLTHAACCYIGYIIACVLMRLLGTSVERSLRSFAEGRLPGIYKDGAQSLCQCVHVHLVPHNLPPRRLHQGSFQVLPRASEHRQVPDPVHAHLEGHGRARARAQRRRLGRGRRASNVSYEDGRRSDVPRQDLRDRRGSAAPGGRPRVTIRELEGI